MLLSCALWFLSKLMSTQIKYGILKSLWDMCRSYIELSSLSFATSSIQKQEGHFGAKQVLHIIMLTP